MLDGCVLDSEAVMVVFQVSSDGSAEVIASTESCKGEGGGQEFYEHEFRRGIQEVSRFLRGHL